MDALLMRINIRNDREPVTAVDILLQPLMEDID